MKIIMHYFIFAFVFEIFVNIYLLFISQDLQKVMELGPIRGKRIAPEADRNQLNKLIRGFAAKINGNLHEKSSTGSMRLKSGGRN